MKTANPAYGFCIVAVAAALLLTAAAGADDSVVNSKHDLSTFGPGPVRANEENQVCIFCHTPHNASPAAPLWNRTNPQTYYRIYQSSTLHARVDQPGGSSKMCLSCHDGSVALGMVLSRPEPIAMNQPFMPTGRSDLTNDLSDDHPIGFRYDRALSNQDRQLRSPDQVDHRIELGDRGELECVACHDAHNNELGNFLRLPLREGALCNTCHRMDGWRASSHAVSVKPVPLTLTHGEALDYVSMRDNACNSCHTTHGAPERERLLRAESTDLCLDCHDGLTARDVASVTGLFSGHNPRLSARRHDPEENPLTMPPHVACVDCHNPHAVQPSPAGFSDALGRLEGPLYLPSMEFVPGVGLSGVPKEKATFYYEVCFRCHGDTPVPIPNRIIRQSDTAGNIRRMFVPTAASAHPVGYASRRAPAQVPSLLPEARTRPYMNCQDCHNNADARQLGGSGPNGPHGSRYDYLLAYRYETADFTTESATAYELCYQCHDRNSILGDESFSLHNIHVVRARSPCSACHTPHGVTGSASNHSNLINFDLAIVSGQRLYVDRGEFSGSCTLVCHGVQHVNFTYSR